MTTKSSLLFVIALALVSTSFAKPEPKKPAPSQAKSEKPIPMTTIMKKAAYEFVGVLAEQKKIEATEADKKASILNSLSVSGSVGVGQTETIVHADPVTRSATFNSTNSVSAALSFSLATWLGVKISDLTKETQVEGLKLLRMTLASEVAGHHLTYQSSQGRITNIQVILYLLGLIKQKVDEGKLVLDDTRLALLSDRLAKFNVLMINEHRTFRIANANLEKFLGRPLPPPEPFIPQNKKAINELVGANSEGGLPIDLDATWKGLPWDYINNTYPVPPTADQAFAKSQKNPSLIMAHLGEKLAKTVWYMTLASNGPVFTISISRNFTDGLEWDETMPMDSTVGSANLSIRIGAGIIHSLHSKDLLVESAKLSTKAQKLGVKVNFVQLYESFGAATDQLVQLEKSFKVVLDAINNFKLITNDNFDDFIGLLDALDMTSMALYAQLAASTQSKIQIHGQMGTLLEQMEVEEAREARDIEKNWKK
ncbi:MAG: hypothetical protein AB7H97_11980 [Pseudobdellovibrionaceae bacterium]